MDSYKLKFTKLQSEIFRLFCVKAGMKLSQRKISKLLKVSPTAVAKSLPLLEKEKLIKINKSKEMNLTQVELDRNRKTTSLKRAENLKMFYESNSANLLIENYPGCTIILFGSFARGEDLFNSDIDIAVIGTKKKSVVLEELEKEVRVNTYQNFKEISKELKENIYNGIVLFGGIEL